MIKWNKLINWIAEQACETLTQENKKFDDFELSTDSRQLSSNEVFLPLVGEKHNPHDYLNDLVKKKSFKGFFYEESFKDKLNKDALKKGICVKSTLRTLQLISQGVRKEHQNVRLIALTGSVGKTTVKELLASSLSKHGKTLSTLNNNNNEIGVPLTLLKIDSSFDYTVLEIGARNKHDIAPLASLAHANVALCLNVGSSHSAIFGNYENTLTTKMEIYTHSPKECCLIVPYDDLNIKNSIANLPNKTLSFGHSKNADVAISAHHWNDDGSMNIELKTTSDTTTIRFQNAHSTSPINIAATAAVHLALGLKMKDFSESLGNYEALDGRFKMHKYKHNKKSLTLIDDSYNASPESMKAGLNTLLERFKNKNLCLVLGDMLELGLNEIVEHQAIGELIAKQIKPKLLITVGPLAKTIADSANQNGLKMDSICNFNSINEVLTKKEKIMDSCDLIYTKGSNKMNLDLLIKEIKQ